MPTYQYHCEKCSMLWETFQSIKENIEDPPTHCDRCDPDEEEEGTLYKYLGNCKPSFVLRGEGFHSPGWK